MKNLNSVDLKGKTVFLRADLNVPVKDGVIQDYTRIRRVLPTIQFLKERGAKIILASHFDRPEGKKVPSMSLAFMKDILSKEYATDVDFANDCIGAEVSTKAKALQEGKILLLENLRFHVEEEKNDNEFAKQLADVAEVYINDAFACSHRAHASIAAITEYLPSYPGLLMLEEITNLEASLSSSAKPIVAIVGGKKVSSKFPILNNLAKKVDAVAICGAMANTFLKAKGIEIYDSYHEADLIDEVKKFISTVTCDIILPTDVVCAYNKGGKFENPYVVGVNNIEEKSAILDIGPETVGNIVQCIKNAKTLVWNGPVGMFEDIRFAAATHTLARSISRMTRSGKINSVAGGGDVVSALEQCDMAHNFSYISTAGGAFLEWLEGKELPGITALKK
jgi:phosphoglycerate kinase